MNILILLVLCSGDPGDSRSPTSLYLTHLALVDLIFVTSYLHNFFKMYFIQFIPLSFMKSICYWMETSRTLNMCDKGSNFDVVLSVVVGLVLCVVICAQCSSLVRF